MDPYYAPKNVIRLMLKVVVDANGCWIWQGTKTKDGYGLISIREKNRTVHRYMKELLLGRRVSRNMDASHLCPNRDCCNPDHVVIETHQQNMARSARPSPRRKLTWDQVLEIRASELTYQQLANKLGLHRWVIWKIKSFQTYKEPLPSTPALSGRLD